jgi:hypothetical protein
MNLITSLPQKSTFEEMEVEEEALQIVVPELSGNLYIFNALDEQIRKRQKISVEWPIRTALSQGSQTEDGVPFMFATKRRETVSKFVENLHKSYVLFIRAPPLSGKTGICQLLASFLQESDLNCSVVYLQGNQMETNLKSQFEEITGVNFSDFLNKRKDKRYLILDEGQCTYSDAKFWQSTVKSQLSGYFPNLFIVVAASYGSFDQSAKERRLGTPNLILL